MKRPFVEVDEYICLFKNSHLSDSTKDNRLKTNQLCQIDSVAYVMIFLSQFKDVHEYQGHSQLFKMDLFRGGSWNKKIWTFVPQIWVA